MSLLTGSTSNVPASPTHGMGLDQSDVDSSSSSASSDESAPKDYWFGRKYFECIIAQDVLQHSRLHETVSQVDSRLEKIMQGYPHARGLQELNQSGLAPLLPMIDNVSQHGAYRAMMFCIGAVVRNGDRAQKAALLTVLRRHISHSARESSASWQANSMPKRERAQQDTHEGQQSDDNDTSPSVGLGRYAAALQEHGSQLGFQPVYKVTELSKGSPTFRASVLVAGSSCEGIAKTKKQARHEAAKKACLQMDINV